MSWSLRRKSTDGVWMKSPEPPQVIEEIPDLDAVRNAIRLLAALDRLLELKEASMKGIQPRTQESKSLHALVAPHAFEIYAYRGHITCGTLLRQL